MHLDRLRLTHYKNYASADLRFSPTVNVITGDNGMGKTNILDAIYYTCLGRSYFSGQDRYVLQHEADFVRVHAAVMRNADKEQMVIKLQPRKLKELELNGKKLDRIIDHIGRYLCIVIAPIDVQRLLDGSEERRKYINNTIIQYDKQYITALMTYNRLLKQRNSLLKQMAENRTWNADLLESYTKPMIAPSEYIYQRRQEFCESIVKLHRDYYQQISGGRELTRLTYKSHLNEESTLRDQMAAANDKDRVLGRTTIGIHKDDLAMSMGDQPLKFYGSQGQLKSYIIALKLAQYAHIASHTNQFPILLLDDIFDKLDQHRVRQLLSVVTGATFGQVFITDTSSDRVPRLLDQEKINYNLYDVKDGSVTIAQ